MGDEHVVLIPDETPSGQGSQNQDFKTLNSLLESDNAEELQAKIDQYASRLFVPQLDEKQKTSVHIAVRERANNCLKVILTRLHDVEELVRPDEDGNTPLHIATQRCNQEGLKLLLDASANPNARNDLGETPLHVLAARVFQGISYDSHPPYIEDLQCLLDNSKTDVESLNNNKMTAFQEAVRDLKNFGSMNVSLKDFFSRMISAGAGVDAKQYDILSEKCFEGPFEISERREPHRSTLSLLYNDLILENEQNVINNLEKLVATEQKMIANGYFGSKRVLCYLVEKQMKDAVKKLIGFGADIRKKNINGDQPLHLALKSGNADIIRLLTNFMKELKRDQQDLLSECEMLINNNDIYKMSKSEARDHMKNLLEDAEPSFLNEYRTDDKKTLLCQAATRGNQDAMGVLLEKGAYICSADKKLKITDSLLPGTLERSMDNCISAPGKNNKNGILDDDYTIVLSHQFLIPHGKDPEYKFNETEALFEISQDMKLRNTMKHPLVTIIMKIKWNQLKPFFRLNVFFNLAFVIALTVLMYGLKNQKIIQTNMMKANETDLPELEEKLSETRIKNIPLIILMVTLTIGLGIKEVFQMKMITMKKYVRSTRNYLDVFLVISVFILCTCPLSEGSTRQLAAWAMLTAWYRFLLTVARHPELAEFMVMLRYVIKTFSKLMFLFSSLIIAFSMSLNMIIDKTNNMQHFLKALPWTIVMSTGELEFSDLNETFPTPTAQYLSTLLIFFLFVFLCVLVLMNGMTGLAVGEIKTIREDTIMYKMKSIVWMAFTWEKFFMDYLDKVSFLPTRIKDFMKRTQVMRKGHLKVLPNVSEANKRVVLVLNTSPDAKVLTYFCLDDRDTEDLREWMLEKTEQDFVDQLSEVVTQMIAKKQKLI